MAKRNKHQPGPGQGALFGLGPTQPNNPTYCISVKLGDRSKYLLETLKLLGQVHSLGGFLAASEPDSPNIDPIKSRYGDRLNPIRSGSSDKILTQEIEARRQFAKATGWMALRGIGFATDEEIAKLAREDYIRFDNEHFGGKDEDRKRASFRRTLRKQANLR